jgi:hypothetical protein
MVKKTTVAIPRTPNRPKPKGLEHLRKPILPTPMKRIPVNLRGKYNYDARNMFNQSSEQTVR